MKSFFFLLLPILLFTMSCGDPAPSSDSTTPNKNIENPGDSTTKPLADESASKQKSLPDKHSCVPNGTILEDNQIWIRNHQLLVCIVADSVTKDIDFGESHRILDVYDTKDCKLVNRNILPVNNSPDYPYYLTPVTLFLVLRFIQCYTIKVFIDVPLK